MTLVKLFFRGRDFLVADSISKCPFDIVWLPLGSTYMRKYIHKVLLGHTYWDWVGEHYWS